MLTSELQASLAIANPDSQVFVVLNYQRYAVRSVSLEEIGVVVLVDPLPIAELERKWLMKGFAIALIAGLVLATLSIAAEPKACECGTSCACSVRNNCGCLVSAPAKIEEETAPKLDPNALVPCVDGTWHRLSEYGQHDKSRALAEQYVREHPPVSLSVEQQEVLVNSMAQYLQVPTFRSGSCASGSCGSSGSRSVFFGRRR